jgi:hypothetical protein
MGPSRFAEEMPRMDLTLAPRAMPRSRLTPKERWKQVMIEFPGKEAEKMFASTFKGSNFATFQGCYSGVQMRQHLLSVTAWAHNSRTAKTLIDAVQGSKQTVYLVGMRGGYQAFDNEAINDLTGAKVAVAFVDLDAKLGVKVRNPHNADDQPAQVAEVVSLHNNVAFLHELGHARQWFELPGFFAGTGQWNASNFGKQIKNAAVNMATRNDPSAPRKGTGPLAGVQYNKAVNNFVANHAVFGGIEAAGPKGWSVRIEQDNMFRHEWPICDELRIPKRLSYRDLTEM